MTSKEALNFIIKTFNKLANKPQDIGLFFKFCEAHEKVKQDLDRLEQLEKENQELREKLNTEEECCVMIEKKVKGLSRCPLCDNGLYINQNFCDKCGTKIDWSDK